MGQKFPGSTKGQHPLKFQNSSAPGKYTTFKFFNHPPPDLS